MHGYVYISQVNLQYNVNGYGYFEVIFIDDANF